jgi:hypothetical protein
MKRQNKPQGQEDQIAIRSSSEAINIAIILQLTHAFNEGTSMLLIEIQ